MCRHVAYLGPAILIEELLYTPAWSLLRQCREPRHQPPGRVNGDGFGAGWYDTSVRPEPARYRTARPMWTDRSFRSVAGIVSSSCIVASVRAATPPLPVEESGSQPFSSGRWLFCHNGAVKNYATGVRAELLRAVSDRRVAEIHGASDSEVLFALALDALDGGATPAAALRKVVWHVRELDGGRLNLLLTDGERIAATALGSSLFWLQDRPRRGSVVVSSEPFDDEEGWQPVPEGSLVEGGAGGLAGASLRR